MFCRIPVLFQFKGDRFPRITRRACRKMPDSFSNEPARGIFTELSSIPLQVVAYGCRKRFSFKYLFTDSVPIVIVFFVYLPQDNLSLMEANQLLSIF